MPPLTGVVVVAGPTMSPSSIGVAKPNGIPVGTTMLPFTIAVASPGCSVTVPPNGVALMVGTNLLPLLAPPAPG